MFILGFIIFLIAIIVSFYVPGRLVLSALKVKLDRAENFILSWLIGIAVFYLLVYLFAWFDLHYIPLYLLIAISAVFILSKFRKGIPKFKLPKLNKPVVSLILLGSLAFASFMFFSGFLTEKGLQFFGVNSIDGIRHISYIKNMMLHFPPEQPGLANFEVRGFHYSYDFILSRFAMYFGLTPEDLYFRFFPFIISLLYGGAFFLAGKVFKASNIKILWILFFAYFSQSFSFLLYFINSDVNLMHHSIVQPIGLIVNPFTVLSLGFFVAGVSLFTKINKSWKYALLVGILLGVISQMKVYAGLVAIASIVLYAAYAVFLKRQSFINFSIAVGTTAVITAITYLPNNFMAGGLLYAPMLFFRQYMQQEFFDSVMQWELKRLVFAEHNNYFRIALLYVQAILIFVVVNLGLRAVVFLKIRNLFTKKFWKDDLSFIWLTIFIAPILIASLFVQSGATPFNSVQFFWIALVLLSVPSGLILGDLFERRRYIVKLLIVIFVLVVTLPEVFVFSNYYHLRAPKIIPVETVQFMKKVEKDVPKDNFITYVPLDSEFENLSHNLLISSLTGRSIYVEPGNIPNEGFIDTHEYRKSQVVRLSQAINECEVQSIENIITEIKAEYILADSESECLSSEFEVVDSYHADNYSFYRLNLN